MFKTINIVSKLYNKREGDKFLKSNKSCNCSYCINNSEFDMPDEIVEAALSKNLVLFCGAGISTESKLVLKSSLYTDIFNELKNRSGIKSDLDLSFSKLMSLYTNTFFKGRQKLLIKIKERFDYIKSFPQLLDIATRFHREVSANPYIETIITTNWDTYFEDFCDCSPIVNDKDCSLWDAFTKRVFKVHGSINNVASIVATEEDYEDSYQNLANNLTGSMLKSLLASKTVVFIGFSFGDEDLNKLFDILKEKLGNMSNQFYLVTVDKNWENNEDKVIIPIITDGTYFVHQLNNILIDRGKLFSKELYNYAEELLNIKKNQHNEIINSSVFFKDIDQYPELLLSIAYQDGIIHALEHCIANRNKGDYLIPGYLEQKIALLKKYYSYSLENEEYDSIYFNFGYLTVLISLLQYIRSNELEKIFMFKLGEKYFETKDELFNDLQNGRDKNRFEYCLNIVNNLNNTVPNFEPWLIWNDYNLIKINSKSCI